MGRPFCFHGSTNINVLPTLMIFFICLWFPQLLFWVYVSLVNILGISLVITFVVSLVIILGVSLVVILGVSLVIIWVFP